MARKDGTKTKAELEALHKELLEEFDDIWAANREVRELCLEDRRFASITGAPWEGAAGQDFENRPRLEFNKPQLSLIRVYNEYRNNRVSVDFTPKDGATNKELADVCDGLYRADEQDSVAEEAYDNAFDEGVSGGFGAARVRAVYEDELDDDNDRQRVAIEPIVDADTSVFFDLGAKRQDKSDARRCYVLVAMPRKQAVREYGHDFSTWQKPQGSFGYDWCQPDMVYLAEVYTVEEIIEDQRIFEGLDGDEKRVMTSELEDDPESLDVLLATGYRETEPKRKRVRKVHKCVISGSKVEEDCGYIAGKCIPIVPFYAKRWYVDNIERCMGHIRLAKDASRLFNALTSWMLEIVTSSGTEKPIFTPEQIRPHAEMWARDNIERYPYLLVESLRDAEGAPIPGSAQPVAYTRTPNIPPAMAALIQIASTALEDLLGNQSAGEELQPNLSGKAIELIQNRLDMQTFIYMSNFGKFMKRLGTVWLSMKREITHEENRRMKRVGADGGIDSVVLKQPYYDAKTGKDGYKYDLADADFDVWADVGPSSSSLRQATVRALTGMAGISTNEADREVLIGGAMMSMDGEGLQPYREYFRKKLVALGVEKPTDHDKEDAAQAQQNQQPDPQSQYLLAEATKSAAQADQAKAKTVEALASAELKRAQTAETMAGVIGAARDQQIASAQALQSAMFGAGPTQVLPVQSAPNGGQDEQFPGLGV